MCSPIDIKQSSDMEMEGKGRMAAHYGFVWIQAKVYTLVFPSLHLAFSHFIVFLMVLYMCLTGMAIFPLYSSVLNTWCYSRSLLPSVSLTLLTDSNCASILSCVQSDFSGKSIYFQIMNDCSFLSCVFFSSCLCSLAYQVVYSTCNIPVFFANGTIRT